MSATCAQCGRKLLDGEIVCKNCEENTELDNGNKAGKVLPKNKISILDKFIGLVIFGAVAISIKECSPGDYSKSRGTIPVEDEFIKKLCETQNVGLPRKLDDITKLIRVKYSGNNLVIYVMEVTDTSTDFNDPNTIRTLRENIQKQCDSPAMESGRKQLLYHHINLQYQYVNSSGKELCKINIEIH